MDDETREEIIKRLDEEICLYETQEDTDYDYICGVSDGLLKAKLIIESEF